MLEQIALLKKPKTNIQIVQKNVLGKYKIFTEFFKDQNPQVLFYQLRSLRKFATTIEKLWPKSM